MSQPAPLQRLEVVVEAADEPAFRATLDRLAREGVELAPPAPLAVGGACVLVITSHSGACTINAEAKVLREAGPGRVVAAPVRFGQLVVRPPAPAAFEQLALEGSATAAVPIKALALSPDSPPRESSARDASAPGGTGSPATGSSGGPSQPRAEEAPPELQPFEPLGNYQVLRHLGGGGMAEVYLARSLLGQGVDKVVALKTARAGFGPATPYGAMFLDEARVSATLQHPNLVQVFDFGEAAGRPYLAMEFIAGRDVSAVLKRLRASRTPAPPSAVVAIGLALCRALEYVHERRDVDGQPLHLVHRDVGPANLMLTPRAEVKLMDFGVAVSERSGGATAGLMVGKLGYMPAGQLLGEAPAPDWDLYAAGVTLYQLAALFHPYQGNPMEYLPTPALRLHRGPPATVNPAVPPALSAVLFRATQLEASERFATARELRAALEQAQRETGPVDLGAWVSSLFGPELAHEEQATQALVLEGRTRTAREVPALLRPVLAPLEAVRRRVVYSDAYRRLARRPWVLRSLAAGLGALLLAGGVAGWSARGNREALHAQLARADAHLRAGRLNDAGPDDALDALLEAKARWPADPRLAARLGRLAARFESLGAVALERGNLEEAAAHLEAALRAEPGRPGATAQLTAVEEKVRERSKARVLQSP